MATSPLRKHERLRIGELASRLGLNPKTIRYYEQVGLIPAPARSENGYRLYAAEDEDRLRFVCTARRVGLSLGEIKEVLALRDRGRTPCEYVAQAIERKVDELDRQISDLKLLKSELARLRTRARSLPQRSSQTAYCHILEE